MASSLKELKTRINSVNSTMKITSAMKMISSSKLHKAQATINSFLPYQKKLDAILTNVLSSDTSYDTPFTQVRETKRIALVAFASNTSLCGAYNSNVIKKFKQTYAEYEHLGQDNILIYPIGFKVAEAVKKIKLESQGNYREMAETPSYEDVQALAKDLIDKYVAKELDEVILIYHHFVTTGTQKLMTSTFLPFNLKDESASKDENEKMQEMDYIYEPSKEEILQNMIPTVLYSRLYAALLDAQASEHAGRMLAMQTATDNAIELTDELNIHYNKSRQQAVTNELLDIIGGSSALQ